MKHIHSRQNPLIRRLARLLAGRGETGERGSFAVLEGVHLCQEWLLRRGEPECVLFDAEMAAARDELGTLVQRVADSRRFSVDSRVLAALSRIAAAQGVLFLVRYQAPAMPAVIDHPCVWLEHIQDPGNVGTLLRTAAAAGLGHAYLSTGCAGAWSPRVLRSAQGAQFSLTIHENIDLIDACERSIVPLVTTGLDSQARCLYETPLTDPCAWVFGHEGQGVSPALLQRASIRVHIPQSSAVESLNVAAAAAICLFEQRRQQTYRHRG